MPTPDHIRAHRHSIHHREEVRSSEQSGCFYCLAIFTPFEIREWTDTSEGQPQGATAICPKCGIDAVIGSELGYPITKAFLLRMERHWFNDEAVLPAS